jgi:3-phosphoshikimate 1-carboxyvinyltransferase
LEIELARAGRLKGEITPPPDKSISHRAVIFSSIAKGKSVVRNFLRAADTLSTLNAMRSLGVEVDDGRELIIRGRGLRGLKEPLRPIDCGNSGTTMRLLAGVLSGNPFFSVLTGDESLSARPMDRVIRPMSMMGARILARDGDRYPPIAVSGGGLKAIRYEMPVASAQVKSAVLLAGLYAEGETVVVEKLKTRDHTERMLTACGAGLKTMGQEIIIKGGPELRAMDVAVPNDFSSAAFFIAAALMVEGSELTLRDVGMNPARTGFIDVLEMMGARVEVLDMRDVSGEPVADLRCRHSPLKAVEIGPATVPSMIDEFPVFCVLASQAEGVTRIRGAEELRVKESDRISSMADGLGNMGVEVEEVPDGMDIRGGTGLRGAPIESRGDHRVAMAFSVAALAADGKTSIRNAGAVDISFPGFYDILKRVTA